MGFKWDWFLLMSLVCECRGSFPCNPSEDAALMEALGSLSSFVCCFGVEDVRRRVAAALRWVSRAWSVSG